MLNAMTYKQQIKIVEKKIMQKYKQFKKSDIKKTQIKDKHWTLGMY